MRERHALKPTLPYGMRELADILSRVGAKLLQFFETPKCFNNYFLRTLFISIFNPLLR